jgi:hypothetical protein
MMPLKQSSRPARPTVEALAVAKIIDARAEENGSGGGDLRRQQAEPLLSKLMVILERSSKTDPFCLLGTAFVSCGSVVTSSLVVQELPGGTAPAPRMSRQRNYLGTMCPPTVSRLVTVQ